VYTIQQWVNSHPGSAMPARSDLQVPLICELMPTRWSYEALVFAEAKLNPLTRRQEDIQAQINKFVGNKDLKPAQEDRLEDLKDTLAVLSGLEASDPKTLDAQFAKIDAIIAGGTFDRSVFKGAGSGTTAEQLYVNQKVTDLIAKAEMEQSDYRENRHINVFFGPVKEYFGLRVGVVWFNSIVLVASTLGLFFLLYLILRAQIRHRVA
jgi:hypothetical protein